MMSKAAVATENAPAAIGPYSQAVRVGSFLFTSGQSRWTRRLAELVGGGVEQETRQVLRNLKEVLIAAGAGLQDVVRTTIFLTNMGEFATVNRVYAEYFEGGVLPARSTVEVAKLPRGGTVEIDAIAFVRDSQS